MTHQEKKHYSNDPSNLANTLDDDDLEINENCKKGIEYAEKFSKIKSRDTALTLRSTLSSYNLSAVEVASLIDLAPNLAEEAKSLIPSYFSIRIFLFTLDFFYFK